MDQEENMLHVNKEKQGGLPLPNIQHELSEKGVKHNGTFPLLFQTIFIFQFSKTLETRYLPIFINKFPKTSLKFIKKKENAKKSL